ncbi:MAG: hypothetical protein WBN40_03460 [Pseudomonadales bacterium]
MRAPSRPPTEYRPLDRAFSFLIFSGHNADMADCDYFDYWKVLTTLIAALVAFISYQQYRINKRKLRLDLFDRRYKVYEATRVFIIQFLESGRIEQQMLHDFWLGTSDAKFLFKDEIVEYIDLINRKANELRLKQRQMQRSDSDSQLPDQALDLDTWLESQISEGVLTDKFAPYLRFQDL